MKNYSTNFMNYLYQLEKTSYSFSAYRFSTTADTALEQLTNDDPVDERNKPKQLA